jgi:eukaryotic-like serine/threonine-protein kinase
VDVKDTARSRFRVVNQLGSGPLADVYLCRLQGVAGFEKDVVLKRIVAERASDPLFVRMFLDEARVVARLSHSNIVQVFEAAVEDGVPYIAMEYVKGVTLASIIERAHQDGKIHYGHFANLIAQVCDGLDYAHNAHDPSGESLSVVHRDVKPINIVVALEGVAKLLEFGMASAKGRLTETESGPLAGDLRYMAPEQIAQSTVDHRADVFGVGVTLFELTTGRNPFGQPGDSDVEVLDRVMSGATPRPSELVPGYPPQLEAVVLWALERDVARRCPSAGELHDHLQAFIAGRDHVSNQRTLSAWLRSLFPDFSMVARRTPTDSTVLEGPTPPAVRRTSELPPVALTPPPVPTPRPVERTGEPTMPAPRASRRPTPSAGHLTMPPALPPPRQQQSGGKGRWVAVAVVLVAIGLAVWGLRPAVSPPASPMAPAPLPAEEVQQAAPPPSAETPPAPAETPPATSAEREAPEAEGVPPVLPSRRSRARDESVTRRSTRPKPPHRRSLASEGARQNPFLEEDEKPAPRAERPAAPAPPPPPVAPAAPPAASTAPPPAPRPAAAPPRPAPPPVAAAPQPAPPPRRAIPPPSLPPSFVTEDADRLTRMCQQVESAAIAAGVPESFARNITVPMRRLVRPNSAIYPAAMYYFVVREAGRRDKGAVAAALAAAYTSGQLKSTSGQ